MRTLTYDLSYNLLFCADVYAPVFVVLLISVIVNSPPRGVLNICIFVYICKSVYILHICKVMCTVAVLSQHSGLDTCVYLLLTML